ncbi:MAG TPA: hypothetical protein VFC19_32905 [Candidatus Limnocylindrales bacterium]|nr:hypothetical protein [Candidatus Limnocylindrales bacterium]
MLKTVGRVLATLVLAAPMVVMSGQPAQAVTIVDPNNPYGVDFINNDGQWTVWKGCFSYINGSGQLTTIGPGYFGRLIRNNVVLFNDEAGPPGGLNAMRGGLGTFGFHYARGWRPYALENSPFTTDIDNRQCSNGHSQGVYRVDVRQGPFISGGVGVLDLTVWIRDNWGRTFRGPDSDGDGIGDAGIRLDYDIRVYESVIKQWASVTTYFQQNGEGDAYVKEPKFTGTVPNSQAGWRRIAIFHGTNGLERMRTFTGNLPVGSRHDYDNDRLRVRYDFMTDSTSTGGACSTTAPCLNVLFRATPPGGSWNFWESGGASGLDAWAVRSDSRPAVNTVDQPNSNPNNGLPTSWDCNGSSPIGQGVRGWEFGGTSGGQFQPYSKIMTLATGWEGGRGAFDCEPLYRVFGVDEGFTVEMNYSVNDGWS